MAEPEYEIGEGEVERFLGHLDEWGASLDRPERALLHIVLERAAASGGSGFDEVSYAVGPGTASELIGPFLRDVVSGDALTIRAGEIEDLELDERAAEQVVGGMMRQGGGLGWSEWGRG